ncbi:MAG: hypothetical protein QM765_28460 [Myxococcales bacterium]
MRWSRTSWLFVAVACAVLAPSSAQAVKLKLTEDAFLDLHVLIQPQAQARENGNATGDSVGFDLFLRRARLIVAGAVTRDLTFFIDVDAPNFGKGGNFAVDLYVQDAFASYKLFPELIVDAGLLIAPLTHHTVQGATSLNTADYHAFLVKYPTGSNKVWRDAGLQLRGLLLGGLFQYRVGAFGGMRGASGRKDEAGKPLPDVNPQGIPRFAGHLRLNVFDPEPDMFFAGTYFRKKKVLSFGLVGDVQPKAVAVKGQVNDYVAVGGDVFLDLPVAQASEVVFQANAINYWQGDLSPATGVALFAEAGYRWKWIGPVVSYERFVSKTGAGHLQTFHLGLNFWIEEHQANVKADLAFEQDCAAQKKTRLADTKVVSVLTVQGQLYF